MHISELRSKALSERFGRLARGDFVVETRSRAGERRIRDCQRL
jgi:hypothetical protein